MTHVNGKGPAERKGMAGINPHHCRNCANEIVSIGLLVDGSDLQMFSCATCDTRSWQRAGSDIDLAAALSEFETHAGRRR